MRDLPKLRFKLRIAASVVGALVLIAVALVVVLSLNANRQAETFRSLHSQVLNRRGAMVPPQTVEDRVKEAREQIAKLYENRFPDKASAIFEQLGKLASENKVQLNQANYKTEESDLPGIEEVDVAASLTGDYVQTMKFINSLERSKMFFIVDGVNFSEQSGGGNVRLGIRLATFMRGGAQ